MCNLVLHRYQKPDKFSRKARSLGYRSRAALKLLEINNKFRIFPSNAQKILDLGCAPGSWIQVIRKLSPLAHITGIDLLPVASIHGATTFQADIEKFNWQDQKFDTVLSDIAPNTTGFGDHQHSVYLCYVALNAIQAILISGGSSVCKVFNGPEEPDLYREFKQTFHFVRRFKPVSSRPTSKELYYVCKNKL